MKLVPIYFFIALFIGFMFVYTIRNKQYFILKEHKKTCTGNDCNISQD
jgi:hypothetical protein